MILEESFPERRAMFDAEDAGAERPGEESLLDRFPLILASQLLQHQG